MAYRTPVPSTITGRDPGVNEDASKGFTLGSNIIRTDVTPRTAFYCTNPANGAATWARISGTSVSHPTLTTLGWAASGHTATSGAAPGVPSVAAFNATTGSAEIVRAEAEFTTLQRIGGSLVFATIAAGVVIGSDSDSTFAVRYNLRGLDPVISLSAEVG